MRRGPTPFRFENMWLKKEGFKNVLRTWWEGLNFSGSASFILVEELKALKPLLRSWNKEIFDKYEVQKELPLNRVDFWDKEEIARLLSLEEEESRKDARKNYKKWVLF